MAQSSPLSSVASTRPREITRRNAASRLPKPRPKVLQRGRVKSRGGTSSNWLSRLFCEVASTRPREITRRNIVTRKRWQNVPRLQRGRVKSRGGTNETFYTEFRADSFNEAA